MSFGFSDRIKKALGLLDDPMTYGGNVEVSDPNNEDTQEFSNAFLADFENKSARDRILALPEHTVKGPQEPGNGRFQSGEKADYFAASGVKDRAKEIIKETKEVDIKDELDAVRELTNDNLASTRDRLHNLVDFYATMKRNSDARYSGGSLNETSSHELGDVKNEMDRLMDTHLQQVRKLEERGTPVDQVPADYVDIYKTLKKYDDNLQEGFVFGKGGSKEARKLSDQEKKLQHEAEQLVLSYETNQKLRAVKKLDYGQKALATAIHTFATNNHELDAHNRDQTYYVASAIHLKGVDAFDQALGEAWGDYDKKYLSQIKTPLFPVYEHAGAKMA